MYLLVAATRKELEPLIMPEGTDKSFLPMMTGVGPVETALSLTKFLSTEKVEISGVINFGIGGAYPDCGIELLDICVAIQDSFGDIGISFPDRIVPLDDSFAPPATFQMDSHLLNEVEKTLLDKDIPAIKGNFVTVAAASGFESRGHFMRERYNAICENMEGAAVARVCTEFAIPCLEIRCISNMVLDRNKQEWHTSEAVEKCAGVINMLLETGNID